MIEASPGRRSAYNRKRDAAVRECQAAGLAPGSYDPWPDRPLRRIRLRPRPPHYGGLSAVVVTMACVVIAWTAVHALITPDVELVWSVAIGVWAALVMGAGQLWEVRRDRRKHGLSRWEEL